MLIRFTLCLAIGLTFATLERASATPGKIGGVGYADYYYVAAADDADDEPEKRNAFRFRRLYLTYNQSVSERFDVRFRLEANDAGFGDTNGDKRPKMVPFVKHGYLKWNGALGGICTSACQAHRRGVSRKVSGAIVRGKRRLWT